MSRSSRYHPPPTLFQSQTRTRTLFISDRRLTGREIRKLGIFRLAPDDALDREVVAVEREHEFELCCGIGNTMACGVDRFALAKLFSDPGDAGCWAFYVRKCGETVDALTDQVG